MKNNSGDLVAPPSEGITEIIVNKWGKAAFVERFRLPTGEAHDFLAFGSMLSPPPLATVIIFALTIEGKLVTIEQFRYGAKAFTKELPGGCPEGADGPEETLRKELMEETGHRAGQLVELPGRLWFEPASVRAQYGAFIALDCVFVKEPTPEKDEIMKTVLYSPHQWMAMIANGEIDDDKSIAVTWRALAHLGWKFQPQQ